MQERTQITLESGETVQAACPVIISASRATDIPAFYADWFFDRLKKGYSAWINPFNGKKSYISYSRCKFIVFWSKNPKPLLAHLDLLKEKQIGCYVQYSVNDYEKENLEKNVPPLQDRIATFRLLADKLGKGSVVWRFDPLILTDSIGIDTLLARIENIGDQLQGHTEKLVFSFVDILDYRKVKANLKNLRVPFRDWTMADMTEFSRRLVELNARKKWNYELCTCGEAGDFEGIGHNHCVDERLVLRFGHGSPELLAHLGAEIVSAPPVQMSLFGKTDSRETPAEREVLLPGNRKIVIRGNNQARGQRKACGCIESRDVGEYDTCPHLCAYCYANANEKSVMANWKKHHMANRADTITGVKT